MAGEIKNYVDAVNASYDTIDESVKVLETGLPGIVDDVAYLKETIKALQDNPGPISEADQALLTGAQTRVNALAARLAPLGDALKALDEATTRPEPPTP
jgi:hypothetical protein